MAAKRIIAVLAVLGTAVAFTLVLRGGDEATSEVQEDARESEAFQRLEATLDRVKCAWNPRVKARVLADARAEVERLEEPLLSVLSDPGHDRLAEAIDLACELRLESAHPLLVDLVTTANESLQPAAFVAAGHLKPWPTDELMELLRSEQPSLRAAAAESAADAPWVRPLELVIAMLEAPDASVRDAALEALPRQVQGREREELLDWAANADEQVAAWAILAVGRVEFGDDVEALLVGKLDSRDRSTRAAALDALSRAGGRLRNPSRVWALAIDADLHRDPAEQARALYCLERTRSFSTKEIRRELVSFQDPLARFFAARCLVTAGEKEGAEILVELLEAEEQSYAEGVDADAVRHAVKGLLGQLSGLGSSADLDALWAWVHRITELDSRNLAVPEGLLRPASARRHTGA